MRLRILFLFGYRRGCSSQINNITDRYGTSHDWIGLLTGISKYDYVGESEYLVDLEQRVKLLVM